MDAFQTRARPPSASDKQQVLQLRLLQELLMLRHQQETLNQGLSQQLIPGLRNVQALLSSLEQCTLSAAEGQKRHVLYITRSAENLPRTLLSMSSLMRHVDDWRNDVYQFYVAGTADYATEIRRSCQAFSRTWPLAQAVFLELDPPPASLSDPALWQRLCRLPQLSQCRHLLILEADTLIGGDLSALFNIALHDSPGGAVKLLSAQSAADGGEDQPDTTPLCGTSPDASWVQGMLLLDCRALHHLGPEARPEANRQPASPRLLPLHPRFNCRYAVQPDHLGDMADRAVLHSGLQDLLRPPATGNMEQGKRVAPATRAAVRRLLHTELLLAPASCCGGEARALLGHEIIVSLTTFPLRAPHIGPVIHSLLRQSFRNFRLVLWLASEEFTEDSIPAALKQLTASGLEIRLCPDLRSYKKLIPALQAFPQAIIVTADDDFIYPRQWLLELLLSYLEDRHSIHCHEPRLCLLTPDRQHPLPYTQWPLLRSNYHASYTTMLRGGSGALYPPGSLSGQVTDYAAARQLCPNADDLWFWAHAILQGTRIRRVTDSTAELEDLRFYENRTLFSRNIQDNDLYMLRLWQSYPLLRRRLLDDS